MLIALGGLPAVGKSALARSLARRIGVVHLRIDTIEQAMRNAGLNVSGPEGYLAARDLAEDNLRSGHTVIVDSVNPVAITRDYWRETAARLTVQLVEIQVVCSDERQHRQRVESRITDIPGLVLPGRQQTVVDGPVQRESASLPQLAPGERVHDAVAATPAEQVDPLAPQGARARSGKQEAYPTRLDHQLHLVDQRRSLLDFVDADHGVAQGARLHLASDACRIGQHRGKQPLVKQRERQRYRVPELPADIGSEAAQFSNKRLDGTLLLPDDFRFKALRGNERADSSAGQNSSRDRAQGTADRAPHLSDPRYGR